MNFLCKTKITNVKETEDPNLKERKSKFLLNEVSDKHLKDSNEDHIECINVDNNVNNCLIINATAESLPSAPKIFQRKNGYYKTVNSSCSFALNLFSKKCLDTDIFNRFSVFSNKRKQENINNTKSLEFDSPKQKEDEIIHKKKKKNLQTESDIESNILNKKGKDQLINSTITSKLNKNIECPYEMNKCELNENNCVDSYMDMYEGVKKDTLIFHLHHPCKFNFFGEFKFSLILGQIEILGFIINETSSLTTVEVFSPNQCTPLVVETKLVEVTRSNEDIKSSLNSMLEEDCVNQILLHYKANDAILLVEEINSSFGKVINKYLSLSLFPKNFKTILSPSKNIQSTFNFGCSPSLKEFKKNSEWDSISFGQCTLLCGGKGVGKSTLLKYFINQFISKDEKVLCLDFDPGQPEFTPPGFVSAVIVNKPLLGPNFTHITQPNLMVYFGGVNVEQSPLKYLECVDHIIKWCRQNEELCKMKWFVNTMGFCKGLGVDIMVSILKLLNPNCVVQIWSSENLNNYPFFLSPDIINSKSGYMGMTCNNNVSYSFKVINSNAEINKKRKKDILSPAELRSIMMISYFSKSIKSSYYNFNAVQPYFIPLSEVVFGVEFLVPIQDVLKAFNGSIVSMSHINTSSEEMLMNTETSCNIKVIVKPKIYPSFGLAFVRGINIISKALYIISHLQPEDLEQVNFLSIGKISSPPCMFLQQEAVGRKLAYTSTTSSDAIQRVKRIFWYPLASK